MARRLNAQTAKEATLTGNEREAAICALIQKQFPDLWALEQRIEAAKAAHLKPLTDERTRLLRQLKADTTIHNKVLKLRLKEYFLAKEAQDFEDESETAQRLNEIRLSHAALHPGQTVDWIAAINGNFAEPAEKANGADPEPAEPKGDGIYSDVQAAVIQAGCDAGMTGVERGANPHLMGSEQHKGWDRGWRNGDKQRKADAGKKPAATADAGAVH